MGVSSGLRFQGWWREILSLSVISGPTSPSTVKNSRLNDPSRRLNGIPKASQIAVPTRKRPFKITIHIIHLQNHWL